MRGRLAIGEIIIRLRVIAFLVALSACSSPGSLTYTAPATVLSGPPVVAKVQVLDKRDEKPNRIATIRGGYGNPLKVMDTTTPVANEVQIVFTKALQARGMLNPDGPIHFEIQLNTLYADQFVGRKAELNFDLIAYNRGGRVIYSDRTIGKDYEFTFFDNGIFSSIDTLGNHVEALLDKAVDEALDKPALRDALAAASQPGV